MALIADTPPRAEPIHGPGAPLATPTASENWLTCLSQACRYEALMKTAPGMCFPMPVSEKDVQRIISLTEGLIILHLAIQLNAMLETEQLPTCVANLDACLSQVDTGDHAYH